jgi:hypothetical protein
MTESEQDKRRTPRLEIERTVHALTDATSISCKLSDVSKSGARLTLDAASSLPDEFELLLKDDIRKWCRVMRRSEKHVGIKFIAAPNPADTPSESASPPLASQDSPEIAPPVTPSPT